MSSAARNAPSASPAQVPRKSTLGQARHDLQASGHLYGLIETDKSHGLEPDARLRRVFKALPLAETIDGFDALLPGTIKGGGL